DFTRVVELDPGQLGGIVDHLLANGRNQEADKLVRQALVHIGKLSSASPEKIELREALAKAYGAQGRLLVNAGKLQEALQAYAKAVELSPQDANLRMGRGRAYMALQQPDKALLDFSKAIELAPNQGDAPWWYSERSAAYSALKQDDKALAE